jgi:hypothetical protein
VRAREPAAWKASDFHAAVLKANEIFMSSPRAALAIEAGVGEVLHLSAFSGCWKVNTRLKVLLRGSFHDNKSIRGAERAGKIAAQAAALRERVKHLKYS